MGLLNFFKKRKQDLKYAMMLNGQYPIFSQFGENIYSSDIIQSVIDCIVSEMTKLTPRHIRRDGQDMEPLNDDIQKILNQPNEIMTRADFMSKIIWNLFLNYNSLIYPVYETVRDGNGKPKKKYKGLYPLQPAKVEMLEDDAKRLYIRMTFKNQSILTLPYEDVIHIRYKYSFNEYLGGNSQGQPDNEALLQLLQMNNNMMDGVLNAMKTSFQITGLLKAPGYINDEERDEMIAKFNEQLQKDAGGILGLDAKAEYTPIERKIQAIDPETLKFIDSRILRNYGVSLAILSGDYTKPQYQAFYQKKLEPLIIAISQAFTKCLFTQREKDIGHEIIYLPQALIFMDTSQVIEAVRILGDAGDLYENEKRVAFGLEPLEELRGVRMQSLNYVNVEHAREYQLQGSSGGNNGSESGNAGESEEVQNNEEN